MTNFVGADLCLLFEDSVEACHDHVRKLWHHEVVGEFLNVDIHKSRWSVLFVSSDFRDVACVLDFLGI